MDTLRLFFSQQLLVVFIAVGVFGGLAYLWLKDQVRPLEAARIPANTRMRR